MHAQRIYVCMYIPVVHVVCRCDDPCALPHPHTQTRIHIHINAYTYPSTHKHTHIPTHTQTHTHTHTHPRTHIHTCCPSCLPHTYARTHAHKHTHAHTYTHTSCPSCLPPQYSPQSKTQRSPICMYVCECMYSCMSVCAYLYYFVPISNTNISLSLRTHKSARAHTHILHSLSNNFAATYKKP